MRKKYKAKARRKARRAKTDPAAWVRAVNREIDKENGTLIISRGLHTIHTSRAEKRRTRRTDRAKAIKDSEE